MLGCLASLMITMAAAKRVDHAWKLVRRAAGHRQERGALERIFATSVGRRRRRLHVLVPHHPGAGADVRPQQLRVGFRDYYRQFDDLDERELNRERRARREAEKRMALERLPDLDLSGTEWPDMPHSEVVNAAIARARGLVNRYPDRYAAPVRRLLAERHGIEPEQIALGNGAAELLQSAALALLGRGDEVVMPWPSYPLYPLLAAHAGARPVFAEHGRLSDAVTGRTRVLVVCNPNDPTGDYMRSTSWARCWPGCPPTCTCCSTRRSSTSRTRRTWTPACASSTRSRGCWWCGPSRRSTGCPGCAPGYAVGSDVDLLAAVAPCSA